VDVHVRSLPHDLRARVLKHEVFRSALFIARTGACREWLTAYAWAMQEQVRTREDSAYELLQGRGPRDRGLVTSARKEALHALASACAETLIRRRLQSLGCGREAIRALERELASYSMDLFPPPPTPDCPPDSLRGDLARGGSGPAAAQSL
jgi:hypothetical protein